MYTVKNRLITAILLFSLSLLFISCPFLIESDPVYSSTQDPKARSETNYNAGVQWRREIFGSGVWYSPSIIADGYCYFPAGAIPGGGSNIVKIDLDNGRVLWESKRFLGNFRSIVNAGNYIFAYMNNIINRDGYVYVIDINNGELAATVKLGETDTEARQNGLTSGNFTVTSSEYIFWGSAASVSPASRGIRRLDTSDVDFDKDPNEVQIIIPDLVWSDNSSTITSNIIYDNGIIYFITWSGLLVAVDAETKAEKWRQNTPFQLTWSNSVLALYDDKILAMDSKIISYNKNTGELILESDNLVNKPAAISLRFNLHNNILYYIDDDQTKVVSVNIDTLEIIWTRDLREHYLQSYAGHHTYTSRPHIYNGKVFVTSNTGLRVYNADTGAFIGVNTSVNYSENGSIMYNNKLLVLNYNHNNGYTSTFLTAVLCN